MGYRNGANLKNTPWKEVLRLSFDHLMTAIFCILSKLLKKEIGI